MARCEKSGRHTSAGSQRLRFPEKSEIRKRYIIHETLGSGSFGIVVRAVKRISTEQHAVKIIPKEKLTDQTLKRALFREITVMQLLDHPNVVKFCDVFEDREHVYIATEFCPGGTLRQYVNSKPQGLGEREALKYTRQILQALEYLHSKNIAHRDLKLENVVLKDGKVMLIDFGLCFWRRPGGELFTKSFVGTPAYAAPEIQDQKSHIPEKGDMWACGMMLAGMLINDIVQRNLEGYFGSNTAAFALTTGLAKRISPGVSTLLGALLCSKPSKRPSPQDSLTLLDTAILNCYVSRETTHGPRI